MLANELRISKDEPLLSKEQLLTLFKPFLSTKNQKPTPAQSILHTYQDELVQLINDPDYPLKPKIAFEVLCERHDLGDKISYTSFKRFVRNQQVFIKPDSSTCRIEIPPGSEIQIDYSYMGLLYDPLVGRKRRVYAFVATLSHSRHMYIEFVYKQTQQGFFASHVRMFENFGGIPIRLVIDNLKAGVITPDLYDPVLNRAYREMAEYYNTFIDPCRVGRAQDKGKVENQVPVVRQQFRKQMALNPHLDIGSANQRVKAWCLGKQGHRIHGTTQWQPYPVFLKVEKSALKPLPEEPFEVPIWKQATVHSDHYIQFDKKTYSAPHALIGKKVWVKGTEKLVQIFYENTLTAQHLITGHYRNTQDDHFPENVQAATMVLKYDVHIAYKSFKIILE